MQNAGYLAQKKRSPTGLTLVVLGHAGLLGALAMAKGPEFTRQVFGPTVLTPVPIPKEPPPEPQRQTDQQQTRSETPYVPQPPIAPPIDRGPQYPPLPPLPPQPPLVPRDPVVAQVQPPGPRIFPPVRARANLGSYFSTDDYPAAALRAEAEGRTSFTLAIGADGRVTNCTVTGSSGNSALDRATCQLLRGRARYTPARDQNRNPVSGQDRGSVTWRLPSD